MKFSYYPGCTLKTKAKELDAYAPPLRRRRWAWSLKKLKTGSAAARCILMAKDEIATRLSAVRALADARDHEQELLTLCSACHQRHQARERRYARRREYSHARRTIISQLEEPYHGETKVIHYLEMLRDRVGFDESQSEGRKSLEGQKDRRVLRLSSAAAPARSWRSTIRRIRRSSRILSAPSAQRRSKYSMRNECCGGYVALEDKASAEEARGCDSCTPRRMPARKW